MYHRENNTENQNANNVIVEESTSDVTNLRLGLAGVDNVNPITSKNQGVQDILTNLVYEPLFYLTDEYKLENGLALEWSKADSKAYLIKLRQGVKWHNGSDFTSNDVKYTIEKIQSLGADYVYYSNVEKVERVELISDYILKIYLYDEIPLFEYNLTFPIISASFFGDEDILSSDKSNIPMGTGMYKIEAIDISSQIELKLNLYWWNISEKNPKIDKIIVRIYSSVSELYNAYKLGSIDILNASRNSDIESTIGTIGYNTKENYGRDFDYLALNCEREGISQKEVRQAISYAIDKQDIVNNVYSGKYIVANYPLEYGSYLYNSNNVSTNEHNPDKAKQILQDNGWEYKNKYWQKKINNSYVRLKLTILVNSSNGNRVNVANMIKDDLEEIGIQVNLVSVKDNTYENYMVNKNYDILLTGMSVGINPNLNRFFGSNNQANFNNNEAIGLINDVYNISDEDLLKEKYISLQNIYQDEIPYIGLYFNKTTIISSKNLIGTLNPTWYNYLYNIETWYRKN